MIKESFRLFNIRDNKMNINHPLNTKRYVSLVNRLNHTLTLINEYLELRIKSLKEENDDKQR